MALDLEEVSRKFYEILNSHTPEYIQAWLKKNEERDSAEKTKNNRKMRKEKHVLIEKEIELIQLLSDRVIKEGMNASNTIIVCVSSDYSSIVSQLMRHNLSFEGEICEGFSVDVPYPTQTWTNRFISELKIMFQIHSDKFEDKTLLLVEAAIIKGGNYTFLVNWIKENYPNVKVKTLTLFENTHSIFQSDFVGEMYDDNVSDITFFWECTGNNYWK